MSSQMILKGKGRGRFDTTYTLRRRPQDWREAATSKGTHGHQTLGEAKNKALRASGGSPAQPLPPAHRSCERRRVCRYKPPPLWYFTAHTGKQYGDREKVNQSIYTFQLGSRNA